MDWSRGSTVGRGATATVSIAHDRQSGHLLAVKSAELNRSELLQREQQILSTLKSPHIVAYHGFDITLENNVLWYNLIIEYAPYGPVADMARRRDGLEEAVIRTYARQILLGLDHLHSNGIVHCDIKGKNVLVTEEGAKIADFGCAQRLSEAGTHGGMVGGTPVFMAPEVARGEQQGFAADVWSLGCTVLEMITGRPPWPDVSDPISAVYQIGFSGEVPEIPGFMSEQGRDFVSKCLKRDPNERWCVGELLRHEFVEESISSVKEFGSSKSDTPTGVMDGSIWDSWETTQDPTHVRSCNSSGRDRIRRLCTQSTTSFYGNDPNWEWEEEDWITVRNSNETKENYNVDLGKEASLSHCDEPKTVLTTGPCLCNTNMNCKACCYSRKCNGCNKGLLLSGYYEWSCVTIIVPIRKIESQNKEISFHDLLLEALWVIMVSHVANINDNS